MPILPPWAWSEGAEKGAELLARLNSLQQDLTQWSSVQTCPQKPWRRRIVDDILEVVAELRREVPLEETDLSLLDKYCEAA